MMTRAEGERRLRENVVMKVAGSSRPRIRKKLGYRFVLSRVQTQRLGSDRPAWGARGATLFGPCRVTVLGWAYSLRISVPSECSAKAFAGARCEAQFPAGVGGRTWKECRVSV